jgi:creatinine amidohydrolase
MMSAKVMMSELTWFEYERRLSEEDAIVFLPVGAVEQHGYHMAMGTDWLIGTYMARRAAEAVGGIVAPPITYAARSQVRTGGGPHRVGTVNLRSETLIALVYDVLMEIARHGARKIAIIDAHYENRFLLDEACYRAQQDLEARGIRDLTIVKILYPEYIKPETLEAVYGEREFPGLDLEHAAHLETSMMLYCHPEMVDMAKVVTEPPANFPTYDVFPVRSNWVPASGCLSSASTATREIGALLVEEFVERVTRIVRAEFRN